MDHRRPRAQSGGRLGSHFVDVGTAGHINAASGLGRWPEGLELLDRVLHAAGGPHGEARSPGDARAILSHALVPDERPRA